MPASAGRDPDEQEKHRWRTADSMAALATQYPNVDIELDFAIGEPVPILTARSAGCRLLVVGSRGRGVAAGLLSGSVSQALLRSIRGPIAVVRKDCVPAASSAAH
jgi:nucleotide-binding universal stress UspA family protein